MMLPNNFLFLHKQRALLALFCCLAWLLGVPSFALADDLFTFRLASKPFSPSMCKKTRNETYIRLIIAQHRDIILRKVPGQHIPQETDAARKKDYVHSVTLADLTNGLIKIGAIAFDHRHAVIFQDDYPEGISRTQFIAQFQKDEQTIIDKALNTFLRLHSIFNVAVDTCRPYPARITYDTNDEIERIEKGKIDFIQLVRQYNDDPTPIGPLFYHESGKSEGFVDPDAGKESNVSYQAMNPLNFYVPTSYP